MALLSLETRKRYFTKLGLGAYNEKNIRKLQKQYFSRPEDVDGIYGRDTDYLLRHIYNVTVHSKNFKPEEFKCECGGRYCTGYPNYMKSNQMKHLQRIRDHWGRPMEITCGLRCKRFNAEIGGSIQNSKHLNGQATDFYQRGVTDTLAHRRNAIRWIKKQPNHTYTYGDGINSFGNYVSAIYMGNALHTDTK